jgi:exopolysaccharide production protein ExoZ
VQKLRSIQSLRAVAVLSVVLCHSGIWPKGAAGVDLFFVISGFIIATVAKGRLSSEFLRARVRRIYPVYLVALLPWLWIAHSLGLLSLSSILSSLTLWPVYGEFIRPALPAGWSLCYEMLFYFATAAALAWGARRVVAIYLVALAASLVWNNPLLTFGGNFIILEFLAGVAIARLKPSVKVWWLIPATMLFIIGANQGTIAIGQSFSRVLVAGIPAAVLVAAAVKNEHWFSHRFADPAVFLGDASYSVYLIHQLVLLVLGPAVGFALALVFGCAYHLGVERPLLDPRRGRQVTQAAEPA